MAEACVQPALLREEARPTILRLTSLVFRNVLLKQDTEEAVSSYRDDAY